MHTVPDYPLWLGNAGDLRDRHELFRLGIGALVDLAVEEPPALPGTKRWYFAFHESTDLKTRSG